MVEEGSFRQDLFYRINVIELPIPPLRERSEDIALLTEHVLRRIAGGNDQPIPKLDREAQLALNRYRFPGNVRELENILERAMALCDTDRITREDILLPESSELQQEGSEDEMALEPYLEQVERDAIVRALEETRWNRTAAARKLGISFRQLRYRLSKLGID
jgi:two-component system response regulator PilR (NtrC family)